MAEEYISATEGTGSTDKGLDEAERETPHDLHDPDSRLGFEPSDAASHKQSRYEELAETYQDRFTDGHEDRTVRRLRDALTMADRLDCSETQKERVGYVLERLDFSDFGRPPYEVGILALVARVWRENGVPIDNDQIEIEATELQEKFVTLCRDLDTSPEEVRKVRRDMKEHIEVIS